MLNPKVDRSFFEIATIEDSDGEKKYWASKTGEEWWEALEVIRQMVYGYDESATRLQRVLEITDREPC